MLFRKAVIYVTDVQEKNSCVRINFLLQIGSFLKQSREKNRNKHF